MIGHNGFHRSQLVLAQTSSRFKLLLLFLLLYVEMPITKAQQQELQHKLNPDQMRYVTQRYNGKNLFPARFMDNANRKWSNVFFLLSILPSSHSKLLIALGVRQKDKIFL